MNNTKCNFSCIRVDIIDTENEPILLCAIKLRIHDTLSKEKYGYWKCDGEDCIFQRMLQSKDDCHVGANCTCTECEELNQNKR